MEPRLRIVVRPYGSPIPLGFFAFGVGMFMYAALDVGWVKASDQLTVGLLLAIFLAPLQLIATVFAFLGRDGGAATTLGLFSGVLGAVYELGGGHGWLRASGWAALAAFVIAVYGGLAFLLEDLAGRTILPLLRRGGARAAIEHDLDAQFAGLADEAGVRHTL